MEKSEESRQLSIMTLQEPLPEALLLEPIEFLFADHFRQRTLCKILDEIAEFEELDVELTQAALNFLNSDFAPHVQDEEEDLFPLLRHRAEPEDQIEQVLLQLSEEHASDQTDANVIINLLKEVLITGDLTLIDPKNSDLIRRFSANERQHLVLENAIVLPLARVRLTEEDCESLARSMAKRRGVKFSPPLQ